MDAIVVAERLRSVDASAVAVLAVSIAESNLNNAILVRPLAVEGDEDRRYELVAGAHRLAAVKALGWTKVDAVVRDLTDDEARLVEVDENLIRRNLTPHERAVSIQARLKAWGSRFPDRMAAADTGVSTPKRGRPGNAAKFAELSVGMGFAEETASQVGLSAKTVRNAIAISRGLCFSVHQTITGSWVSRNEGVLRQLAGISDPLEQLKVAQTLVSGAAKSVSDARAIAAGSKPTSAQPKASEDPLKGVQKAWKAASKSQRGAILAWLAGQKTPGWTLLADAADG